MAYTRTTWENGVTPLNATNMNNIEDGIEEALAGGLKLIPHLFGTSNITIGINSTIEDAIRLIDISGNIITPAKGQTYENIWCITTMGFAGSDYYPWLSRGETDETPRYIKGIKLDWNDITFDLKCDTNQNGFLLVKGCFLLSADNDKNMIINIISD